MLGTSYPSRCQCERSKMRGTDWDSDSVPLGERANRLRKQTRCGQPEADTTNTRALEGNPMITPARAGDPLGRAPCRQPQHLRRCRIHEVTRPTSAGP
jgi:hypothetical protein